MVSVIVPVYQAEKYLEKCINSILNQTYEDLELILVDDGSTDQSLGIIRQFQKKDKRIRYFHQQNSGVSAARNKGLEMSKGTQILFVDADDTIDVEMLTFMMDKMVRYEAEIVFCGFDYIYNDENVTEIPELNEGNVKKEEIRKYFWKLYDQGILHNIGTKLYSKELLDRGKIKFEEKKQVYEDIQFCLEALKRAERIYVCQKSFYKYMMQINPKSIQKTYRSGYGISLQKLFEMISEMGIEKNKDFYLRFMDNILLALKNEMLYSGKKVSGEGIERCKYICELKEVNVSRKYIRCEDVRKAKYIFYLLIWKKHYALLSTAVKLWERIF